jgi:uncharacterized protein
MNLAEFGKANYIALQTFRKNSEGVNTPVWVTTENELLYVYTQRMSGKVKRIRNHPHVKLCISDARGKPKGEWVAAYARILASPQEIERGIQRVAAKYRFGYWVIRTLHRLRGQTSADAVILELRQPPL